MFAPPRVVAATSPPLNAPRETSYVLVTTRVVRNPSCGTELVLMFRPSSVTALASERSPATENAAAVESVAPMPMTPGTRVASRFRSVSSSGSRATSSGVSARSVEPGVGTSGARTGRGVGWTVIGARDRNRRQLRVPQEAVFVGVALQGRLLRLPPQVARGHLILTAAVRKQDGVAPAGIGGGAADDLGFEGRRLDDDAGERCAVLVRDEAGDDVGRRADLALEGAGEKEERQDSGGGHGADATHDMIRRRWRRR